MIQTYHLLDGGQITASSPEEFVRLLREGSQMCIRDSIKCFIEHVIYLFKMKCTLLHFIFLGISPNNLMSALTIEPVRCLQRTSP